MEVDSKLENKLKRISNPVLCTLGRIVLLLMCLMLLVPCITADSSPANETVFTEDEAAIEDEVLGPLRVWHIVFISISIIIIIMVVAFCCVEIRVPRSRQEIEENYQKRLLNQRYVRMLERKPQMLMRSDQFNRKTPEVSVVSSGDTSSRATGRAAGRDWKQLSARAAGSRSNDAEDDGPFRRGAPMLGNKPLMNGKPTPLAISPQDILAIMAQRRKTED